MVTPERIVVADQVVLVDRRFDLGVGAAPLCFPTSLTVRGRGEGDFARKNEGAINDQGGQNKQSLDLEGKTKPRG